MIYIYTTQTGVDSHTDKEFAENVLKLGDPIATLTEQEWSECEGLARLIDGVLVLGKTETETQAEALQQQAEEAQRQLDATDYIEIQLIRTERLYGKESAEYKELLARRLDMLQQREAWVEAIRGAMA